MSGEMRLIYKDELAELREENKRLHAELEAERARNRWVSLLEKLPEAEEMYIVYDAVDNTVWAERIYEQTYGYAFTHYRTLDSLQFPELPPEEQES